MAFRCTRCGEVHDLPMSIVFEAPVYWYRLPEDQRSDRAMLGEELCIIDNQHFFIKGRIGIPVHDGPGPFELVVWVSLSEANFRRAVAQWERPGREAEPPYFGWLSNQIPCYPSTINLKTNVQTRPLGERPLVELEPTDHPLSLEQRNGVSTHRLKEIVSALLHA